MVSLTYIIINIWIWNEYIFIVTKDIDYKTKYYLMLNKSTIIKYNYFVDNSILLLTKTMLSLTKTILSLVKTILLLIISIYR